MNTYKTKQMDSICYHFLVTVIKTEETNFRIASINGCHRGELWSLQSNN
jgi:hypothetical protein